MLDLVEEFRSILYALQAADIEFAVCGGLAVAIHAHPRATLDIDLLLPRDQVERAREVTRQPGYQVETGTMTVRRDVIEIFRLSMLRSGELGNGSIGSTGRFRWCREPAS